MFAFVPRPGLEGILQRAGLSLQTRIVAEQIEAEARRRVEVLSGDTRDSGRVETTAEGARVTFGSAAVFLEFGTSKMSAQPFLRPAADAVVPGGRRSS